MNNKTELLNLIIIFFLILLCFKIIIDNYNLEQIITSKDNTIKEAQHDYEQQVKANKICSNYVKEQEKLIKELINEKVILYNNETFLKIG